MKDWNPVNFGIVIALVVLLSLNSVVIINPGQAGVLSVLGKAAIAPF